MLPAKYTAGQSAAFRQILKQHVSLDNAVSVKIAHYKYIDGDQKEQNAQAWRGTQWNMLTYIVKFLIVSFVGLLPHSGNLRLYLCVCVWGVCVCVKCQVICIQTIYLHYTNTKWKLKYVSLKPKSPGSWT